MVAFKDLPSGTFFTFPGRPDRKWFKCGVEVDVAVDDDWNVLLVKDDAPCIPIK